MLLNEARNLLEKTVITAENLCDLNSIYLILDLEKEDFCKIIDLIGIEKLLAKTAIYDELYRAKKEFAEKKRYLQAKKRLIEMEEEKVEIEKTIKAYESSVEMISQNDY